MDDGLFAELMKEKYERDLLREKNHKDRETSGADGRGQRAETNKSEDGSD